MKTNKLFAFATISAALVILTGCQPQPADPTVVVEPGTKTVIHDQPATVTKPVIIHDTPTHTESHTSTNTTTVVPPADSSTNTATAPSQTTTTTTTTGTTG